LLPVTELKEILLGESCASMKRAASAPVRRGRKPARRFSQTGSFAGQPRWCPGGVRLVISLGHAVGAIVRRKILGVNF